MNKQLTALLERTSEELTTATGTSHKFAWSGNLSHAIATIWCYTSTEGGARVDLGTVYDISEDGDLTMVAISKKVTEYAATVIAAHEAEVAVEEPS